jgi:hypothetical protein
LFGNFLFEISGFTMKIRDFAGVGLTHNISSQALLAGFHEVLGPFVTKALGDALSPAQPGYSVFATQVIQYDEYSLLRTVLLTRLALDVKNDLF